MTAVWSSHDDARFLEPLQPIGKDVGGDAFGRGKKVALREVSRLSEKG